MRFKRLATLLLGLAAAACSGDSGGDPTDTGTPTMVTRTIEVPNIFAAAPAPADGSVQSGNAEVVEIRKIRVTVYESPSNKVLFQSTYDVDPMKSSWTVPFQAPIGASIRITSELISVTSGVEKVEYSGQAGPLIMTSCTSNCTPIQVTAYPGPVDNLPATSVVVSPDTKSMTVGQTTQLTTTVLPAGPAYQPVWTSTSSAATVNGTGLVTAVSPGTAKIIVIVGAVRDTATFTITAPTNACVETAYTIGTSVNGSWADGDCLATSGSGRRYDMYKFTVAQQTAFRAQVTGPAGRRINLRRAGTQEYVQLMAGEDFMPSTSNPLEARYVLAPGSYVFEIANPDANTLGNYTLSTSTDATASCSPLVFVTLGVTINEQLSASDCNGAFGGKEDWFILIEDPGKRVDLTLATTQFAPVLAFRDDRLGPASPTLTSDVRLTVGATARTSYTTTFSGFHEIIVNNATAALGSYTLTVGQGNAANTCVVTPTTISGRTLAFWEPTDCQADGRVYDRYSFGTTSQTSFKTTQISAALSKSTGVFAGGVEVLEWLRSAAGDLEVNWFLAPGQYELRSAAPVGAAGSSYTLVTTPTNGDITCATNTASAGVTFSSQTLGGTDCTFNSRYEDRLSLYVEAGKDIVVTMTGASFAPSAIIRDPGTAAGTFLVLQRRADPGAVTATYHTTVAGYYQVIFSTDQQNATGSYSGSITVR